MPAQWNLPSLTQQESRRAFDNDEDLDAPFKTVDPWRGRWGRRLNDATVDVEAGPSASQILAQAPFGRYKPDAVPRVPQVVPEDVSLSPSSTELDLEVDVRRRKLRSRGRTESIIQPAAGPYHDAAGYGTPVPPSAHVPYGLDDGSPSPFRPPSDTILWPPSTYTPSIRLPPNHLPSARTPPSISPSSGLLFTRPPSPEPPSTRPPSIRSSTLSHGPHGRTLSSLDKAESEHSPRSLTSLDFQWVGPFHSRPESVVEPGGASMETPAPIPEAPPAPLPPPPIHISVNAEDSAELHSPPRPSTAIVSTFVAFATFMWQVVPTTLYLCALFRLPALYFSRVARVFENADLCRRDIIRMAVARATQWEKALGGMDAYGGTRDFAHGGIQEDASGGIKDYAYGYQFHEPQGYELSFPLLQFKKTWEQFVDNLLHEWKVLNVISALLTSAVLTILQIDAAAADPIVRTAALLALVCTLMSLLYGCLYTVRFGSMKAMYKASEWALEAQKTTTNRFWNVWVMLAMPAVWLLWSIISFIVSIMAFVWRTGAGDELEHANSFTTPGQALASRVIISASLSLGAVYFVLVVRTFTLYGDRIDRRWRENVHEQMRRERQLKAREAEWKGREGGDNPPVGEMHEEKEASARGESPELPTHLC